MIITTNYSRKDNIAVLIIFIIEIIGVTIMLNQPSEEPYYPPVERDVKTSDVVSRNDDLQLQREIDKINREMEYDYD